MLDVCTILWLAFTSDFWRLLLISMLGSHVQFVGCYTKEIIIINNNSGLLLCNRFLNSIGCIHC